MAKEPSASQLSSLPGLFGSGKLEDADGKDKEELPQTLEHEDLRQQCQAYGYAEAHVSSWNWTLHWCFGSHESRVCLI